MAYLKLQGESIFDGYRFTDDNSVLILTRDGEVVDTVPAKDAGEDIRFVPGILAPGLVNCHCHLELSHMKGRIEKHTGLVQFVTKVIFERSMPEHEILRAIETAEEEMLQNGIVAVGDICNNGLTLEQKKKGRIWYHNFIEASGFSPGIAAERFARSVELFRSFGEQYSIPVESNSIVPHAPYSVADELWKMILHFPGNHLLTIHNQEAQAEGEWFMYKTGELRALYETLHIDTGFFEVSGRSSLQSYIGKFLRNQSLILVHNVHTKADDIESAKQAIDAKHLHWCLCPNANLYISNLLPDPGLFIRNDCNIVLGTDSLASNEQLNLMSEIQTLLKNNVSLSLETALQWATLNGARALQMDAVLGSFEKGKRPGVISIDPENIEKVQRIL